MHHPGFDPLFCRDEDRVLLPKNKENTAICNFSLTLCILVLGSSKTGCWACRCLILGLQECNFFLEAFCLLTTLFGVLKLIHKAVF